MADALLNGMIAGHRVAQRCVALDEGAPSGDAAAHFVSGDMLLLTIIDGLGHGVEAAHAAQAALGVLAAGPTLCLPDLLVRLDAELTGTRGAAIGLARIEGGQLRYAGVGNTRALRWRNSRLLRLSSEHGIVGGGLSLPVSQMTIDVAPGDWLVLYTDGLEEMLQFGLVLPEWERDPALLCTHLLARWRQVRDDAGVLVCRIGGV